MLEPRTYPGRLSLTSHNNLGGGGVVNPKHAGIYHLGMGKNGEKWGKMGQKKSGEKWGEKSGAKSGEKWGKMGQIKYFEIHV